MVCCLCHAGTLPFLGRNYMAIKPRATQAPSKSVTSPLFPCLTLPLRNLSLGCDFLTGKWIWWLHSQVSPFDGPQSTNILILCSEKWLIPPVLNELVDRHAFIFPIPVCNQPRRHFLKFAFYPQFFWWGPRGSEWWNSNVAVERSLPLLICGMKMGWQHQKCDVHNPL